MDVIIFADRKGQELLPLTDQTCVPLLPLAGKLIIEHTLEDLVDAGFRQAHIILSPFAEQVKQALGNGKRWGMTLSYSTSRGEGSALAELRRLKQQPKTPFLVMRGDVVRSRSLKDFLLQAETADIPVVPALFNGANAYLLVCRNVLEPLLHCLDWTVASPTFAASHAIDINGCVAGFPPSQSGCRCRTDCRIVDPWATSRRGADARTQHDGQPAKFDTRHSLDWLKLPLAPHRCTERRGGDW